MIILKVSEKDILFAKNQIKAFEKIDAGKWRYDNVEAWRGIVCEILTSKWLEKNFQVQSSAKGLDDSGMTDDYDLMIKTKKIEIKSATKNYFKYIMPKVYDIHDKPKDIYVGTKYNEQTSPNTVQIIGFIYIENIKNYPIEKNKGAPYYKIPLNDLTTIEDLKI